jgi:hypothetical protein
VKRGLVSGRGERVELVPNVAELGLGRGRGGERVELVGELDRKRSGRARAPGQRGRVRAPGQR